MSNIFGAGSGGGGGGSITIDGDSGSASGSTITLSATQSLSGLGCGHSVSFTASGSTVILNLSDGNGNTYLGLGDGKVLGGSANVAIGGYCLTGLTSQDYNVAIGYSTMDNLTGGGFNIAIGYQSGSAYTGSEGFNICINANGVEGESNTLHLGDSTSGHALNKAYIGGIYGVTTSGSAVAVLIDSTGNLGTVSSSLRYKELIRDMGKSSDFIYQLRPVTFSYIKDKSQQTQIGLIAEEVEKIYPNLVVYDGEGRPDAVKYHELPVLLLNEIQKLKKEIEQLKGKA